LNKTHLLKNQNGQIFYTQTNITQGIIAAYVYDDPDQVYLVKSTGTAAGNTALGTGNTGYGIVHAAGNTNNGIFWRLP
jgi:hypothetical protein